MEEFLHREPQKVLLVQATSSPAPYRLGLMVANPTCCIVKHMPELSMKDFLRENTTNA